MCPIPLTCYYKKIYKAGKQVANKIEIYTQHEEKVEVISR